LLMGLQPSKKTTAWGGRRSCHSHIRIRSREVAVNAGQYIQWQDLFVLVDDGSIPISRYAPLEVAMREQARTYPRGVALLCILPPDARPPPEEVRRSLKATLMRLAPMIPGLAD